MSKTKLSSDQLGSDKVILNQDNIKSAGNSDLVKLYGDDNVVYQATLEDSNHISFGGYSGRVLNGNVEFQSTETHFGKGCLKVEYDSNVASNSMFTIPLPNIFAGDWTIDFWAKAAVWDPENPDSYATLFNIINLSSEDIENPDIAFYVTTNGMTGVNYYGTGPSDRDGEPCVADEEWHHYAFVYSRNHRVSEDDSNYEDGINFYRDGLKYDCWRLDSYTAPAMVGTNYGLTFYANDYSPCIYVQGVRMRSGIHFTDDFVPPVKLIDEPTETKDVAVATPAFSYTTVGTSWPSTINVETLWEGNYSLGVTDAVVTDYNIDSKAILTDTNWSNRIKAGTNIEFAQGVAKIPVSGTKCLYVFDSTHGLAGQKNTSDNIQLPTSLFDYAWADATPLGYDEEEGYSMWQGDPNNNNYGNFGPLIAGNPRIYADDPFTYEHWVKLVRDENSSSTHMYTAYSMRDQYGSEIFTRVGTFDSGNNYTAEIVFADVSSGASVWHSLSYVEVQPNTWIHMCVTKTADGVLTGYVNGVKGESTDPGANFADVAYNGAGSFSVTAGDDDYVQIKYAAIRSGVQYTSNFTPDTESLVTIGSDGSKNISCTLHAGKGISIDNTGAISATGGSSAKLVAGNGITITEESNESGEVETVISATNTGVSPTTKTFTGLETATVNTGLTLANYDTIMVFKNGVLFTEDPDELGESLESTDAINDYYIDDNDIVFHVALEHDDVVTVVAMGPVSGSGSGLPSQTGNSGKFLTTDGTTASWDTVSVGSTTQTWFKNQTGSTLDISSLSGDIYKVYKNGLLLEEGFTDATYTTYTGGTGKNIVMANTLPVTTADSWKLEFRVTWHSTGNGNMPCLFGSSAGDRECPSFHYYNGDMTLFMNVYGSSSEIAAGAHTQLVPVDNSIYDVILEWTGTVYSLKYKLRDDSNYTTGWTTQSTARANFVVPLMFLSQGFNESGYQTGSSLWMDFVKITVNNSLWFDGATAVEGVDFTNNGCTVGTTIDTSDPNNYNYSSGIITFATPLTVSDKILVETK